MNEHVNAAATASAAPVPTVFARGEEVYTNSQHVAAYFGKRHDNVLRDIDALVASSSDLRNQWFQELSDFHELANRKVRSFDLTKDGFTLLVMGYTGPKALPFKLAYIAEFNAMEAKLRSASHLIGDLSPEVRKIIGGICKSVMHAEAGAITTAVRDQITNALANIAPSPAEIQAAIQAEMSRQQFILRRGKTAGQIWRDNKMPPLKNIASWFGNLLSKAGCRVVDNGCAEMGLTKARLFDPDKAQLWIDELGGRHLIEQKIASRLGQKSFTLVPMPTPIVPSPRGIMAVLAAMVMSSLMILGTPDPAKALTARDGLAVMHINGKPVTVDTTRFKVGPDDQVVRLHYDGRIDVGTVRLEGAPNWHGARGAMEPWRDASSTAPHGYLRESGSVQILGAVVRP